jgi:hypothetical protein
MIRNAEIRISIALWVIFNDAGDAITRRRTGVLGGDSSHPTTLHERNAAAALWLWYALARQRCISLDDHLIINDVEGIPLTLDVLRYEGAYRLRYSWPWSDGGELFPLDRSPTAFLQEMLSGVTGRGISAQLSWREG